jgi:hypothetical protein
MPEQMTLYGSERHPPRPPRRLSWRQRELLHYVATWEPLRASACPTHRHPAAALARLERLGLVVRGDDGLWRHGQGRR